jgi:NTP pyrophosphatase (non-canonical NTP hydrolase)
MRDVKKVLGILTEECAEVIQAVSKINRFGMENGWNGVSNRESLITEIGDVMAVLQILVDETDINITEYELMSAIEAKHKKLEVYLPHEP